MGSSAGVFLQAPHGAHTFGVHVLTCHLGPWCWALNSRSHPGKSNGRWSPPRAGWKQLLRLAVAPLFFESPAFFRRQLSEAFTQLLSLLRAQLFEATEVLANACLLIGRQRAK